MAENSKFAKGTWQLNPLGWPKLMQDLEDAEGLKTQKGKFITAQVATYLDVSAKTARAILAGTHAANLSTWRRIFDRLFGDEIRDLSESVFCEMYCEASSIDKARSRKLQIVANSEDMLLMIRVKPHPPEHYVISGVLLRDCEPSSLVVPGEEQWEYLGGAGHTVLIDQFETLLCEFIDHCGVDASDLIVQWFLPIELMNLPVEHFQISEGRYDRVCHGKECRAVKIRSFDRQYEQHYRRFTARWRDRWKTLLASSNASCAEVLPFVQPQADAVVSLCENPAVIGGRFTQSDDKQSQERLWDKFFVNGMPIALWMRSPDVASVPIADFDRISDCSIVNLPSSLATARQNELLIVPRSAAANTITDRQGVSNLSLLWDNPFRPFPEGEDDIYESKSA